MGNNRYLLPLISEMLDRLCGAWIFTKLDLRNAYNLIRIMEGDKYTTAVRTEYCQLEYQVMLFGLTNAPAIDQTNIVYCIRPHIDDFAVFILDNILICSANKEGLEHQVRKLLGPLNECCLYPKGEKCHFGVNEVAFLGFVISPNGISMPSDHILKIKDWPTPESVRDVEVLLGFMNFHRRFVTKYANVTTPISELLKKVEPSRTPKQFKWKSTHDAKLAFWKLNRSFTDAPSLDHFNSAKPIILQTHGCGLTIAGILNQYDVFGNLRPVNV
jgi:hypothetical protein